MNEVTQEQKTWGMIAHLSALVGLIIPFGNILGPLVVWLVKKDTMPFVDDQGKEALNFNITLAIVIAGLMIVGTVLLVIGSIVIALVLGVLSAIYLSEYATDGPFTRFLRLSIVNLAGVPSIVFGLLGLAVFIQVFGLPRSAPLVGGLVLGAHGRATPARRAAAEYHRPHRRARARYRRRSEAGFRRDRAGPAAAPCVLPE